MAHSTERKADHTLTVREVARMFEAAGVARTERSIVNWCQPTRTGIARLDSYYDPNERRYYITAQSVSLAIQEEQSKAARGGAETLPPPEAETVPKTSERRSAPEDEGGGNPATESELKRLRQENLDLQITNRGKDYFIEQLQKERAGFGAERQGYVEKLMAFNHRLGTLESQLLQLSAPRGNVPNPPEATNPTPPAPTESVPFSTPQNHIGS